MSNKQSEIENAAGTLILLAEQQKKLTQKKQRSEHDERQTIITIRIHLKDKTRFIYFGSFYMNPNI